MREGGGGALPVADPEHWMRFNDHGIASLLQGAFDVAEGRKLRNSRVFAVCEDGLFDGFRLDTEGNLWTSAGTGVSCYAPSGDLLGRIPIGEAVSNVTFGGPKRNRLFITATTSLYAVYLNAKGAQWP